MNFELQELNQQQMTHIQTRVEGNSVQIDDIVNGIIAPYCEGLDRYVAFILECLKDGTNPPTTDELEDFCLNLSTNLYFAAGMCENLGIRDDIAKAVYKEVYNASRNSLTSGTVADKDSIAALQSQEEALISNAYTRAYKTVKAKVENAQELLSSCKKVLSHRIQQEELTHFSLNQDSRRQ